MTPQHAMLTTACHTTSQALQKSAPNRKIELEKIQVSVLPTRWHQLSEHALDKQNLNLL